MRIYIRHADKLYANGKADMYKHDPGIIPGEEFKIGALAGKLIQKYGLPTMIICSPYLRTRQTAHHLIKTIYQFSHKEVPLFCDVDLSEYLGNRPNEIMDVTPDTKSYNPPHPEKFHDLSSRVQHHNTIVRGLEAGNIWCITHGIVIKALGHIYGVKCDQIEPLEAFRVADSFHKI